jgi:hypothetical protein
MEDVGLFYVPLVYFPAIWYIFMTTYLLYFVVIWYIFDVLVHCTEKNLATLLVV